MLDVLIMMGLSFLIVTALMLLLWVIYLAQGNVAIVDIGWGISFIFCTLVYFIFGAGYVWRKLLILLVVSIWALRLVAYLVVRFQPNQQDPRYQTFLSSWREPLALKVLALFLLQGFIAVVLTLPFALMSQNILPFFTTTEVFGLLLWMGALLGEAIADRQLYLFKKQPGHENQVYDKGLWYYSRHPNYFFEWFIWIAYFVMAVSSLWGWLAIVSPILMLYLLLKVSGIPLAEEEAIRTKGDAYRTYQQTTSSFIPWFKV